MKVKEERHHKVLTDENIAGGDGAGLQDILLFWHFSCQYVNITTKETVQEATQPACSQSSSGLQASLVLPIITRFGQERKLKLSNVLQHRPIFKACDDEISFTTAT